MIHSFLVASALTFLASRPAEWHHPLYLGGDGYWRARVAVAIENGGSAALDGQPVFLAIGAKAGEANLEGAAAEAVRVCRDDGTELLFAVVGPDGATLRRGPIPAGSSLVLPALCPPQGSVRNYIYFDNPSAGVVPDHLAARLGVVNGGMESGAGEAPQGWLHDEPDDTHAAHWSDEAPRSGRRCLKTVVAAGAEPSWISTRQGDLHIEAGGRYRLSAWVRARDVSGSAGWYMHVGTREQPMMLAPMLSGGEGSFDWKEVSQEFTAPAGATVASVGTVLRGTGTAWFDDCRLERLGGGNVIATAGPTERLKLDERDPRAWSAPADYRAAVRVLNAGDEPRRRTVHVDLAPLSNRVLGRLDLGSLRVMDGDRPVAATPLATALAFEADLPARSIRTYHVYYGRSAAGTKPPAVAAVAGNRVANGGFEEGESSPASWKRNEWPPGDIALSFDAAAPGREGRSLKVRVPAEAKPAWRGIRQSVAVDPGATYLVGGWLKCQQADAPILIHLHFHDAQGKVVPAGGMSSVGPAISGDSDWTSLAKTVAVPAGATQMEFHLTTNGRGTMWYDDIFAVPAFPVPTVRMEGRPLAADGPLAVWSMPAVAKAFPDEPAPVAATPLEIGLARNEAEPLQLLLRSGRRLGEVRVEVAPLEGPGGARLPVEVNIVGYVPIDYPTNYYHVEQMPAWQRKIPTQPTSCDGWAGLWPDPLLPAGAFALEANQTRAVWLTVRTAADAATGEYRGVVRVAAGGQVLAERPLVARVWNFALPHQRHLAALYDVRPTSREPAGLWGERAAAYAAIGGLLASRRLSASSIEPPPSIRYEGGRVVADFSRFDEAAERFFGEWRGSFSYMPHVFYLFGWGHPPEKKFGEEPFAGEDRTQVRPEFRRAYQACLRAFWDHVGQKGWQKKFIFYISDEPYDHLPHIRRQMQMLCDLVHEVDPAIPIYSSTWRHVPDWDGYLNVWGVGHYGLVAPEKLAALRKGGARLWFTTDGQMCTDTPLCAVERLLPHYCFKYGADAYEFWGASWLTYDPHQYGWHAFIHQSGEPGKWTWVRYPNGDGYLAYPGGSTGSEAVCSSIRLEQARDGAEDYEYLYLLRAKAATGAAGCQAVLDEAAKLVQIPNAGGRYSSKTLPEPAALDRFRRAAAAALSE